MVLFQDYTKVFFWSYSRMDNVNYNFDVLTALAEASRNAPLPHLFYKPMFILMTSIIECTIYDFLKKVHQHKHEKVPHIDEEDVMHLQNIKLPNKLYNFTSICRKYELLGSGHEIYDSIHEMVEIRNRIHIQNERGIPREEDLWDLPLIQACGDLFLRIFTIMCMTYPRPGSYHKSPPMKNFPRPWESLGHNSGLAPYES